MAKYPCRESHFAHKLVRLMMRTCAAQEIGSDAALLVTMIAHTEDAKRYTAPVTFWNDQLMSIMGFSWGKLDRARKRAVASNWLHYEPGGRGKVGKYWAIVPAKFTDLTDVPADCDAGVILSTRGETNGEEKALSSPPAEREAGEKRGRSAEHSTLDLNLNLQEQPSVVCSEPPQAAHSEPPVESGGKSEYAFPIRGKGAKHWWLPAAKLEEYRESFPGIDVEAEMRKARQWARDNKSKRKTASGMLGFLTRWLNREANRGDSNGNSRSPRAQEEAPNVSYDFDAYLESQKPKPKATAS